MGNTIAALYLCTAATMVVKYATQNTVKEKN